MGNEIARIIIDAPDKRQGLLAARRIQNLFEQSGAKIIRGVFVLNDGRLYLDVPNEPNLPEENKLSQAAGIAAKIARQVLTVSPAVSPCINCGNIPEHPFAVCPNCGFREISPCPSCGSEVPRTSYVPTGGSLFRCPNCSVRVRLAYNEPISRNDGRYNEPIVIVTEARQRQK